MIMTFIGMEQKRARQINLSEFLYEELQKKFQETGFSEKMAKDATIDIMRTVNYPQINCFAWNNGKLYKIDFENAKVRKCNAKTMMPTQTTDFGKDYFQQVVAMYFKKSQDFEIDIEKPEETNTPIEENGNTQQSNETTSKGTSRGHGILFEDKFIDTLDRKEERKAQQDVAGNMEAKAGPEVKEFPFIHIFKGNISVHQGNENANKDIAGILAEYFSESVIPSLTEEILIQFRNQDIVFQNEEGIFYLRIQDGRLVIIKCDAENMYEKLTNVVSNYLKGYCRFLEDICDNVYNYLFYGVRRKIDSKILFIKQGYMFFKMYDDFCATLYTTDELVQMKRSREDKDAIFRFRKITVGFMDEIEYNFGHRKEKIYFNQYKEIFSEIVPEMTKPAPIGGIGENDRYSSDRYYAGNKDFKSMDDAFEYAKMMLLKNDETYYYIEKKE